MFILGQYFLLHFNTNVVTLRTSPRARHPLSKNLNEKSKTCDFRFIFWTVTCLVRALYEVYLSCSYLH